MNSTQGQGKPQRITETTEPTWGTPVASVPSVSSVANPMARAAQPTRRFCRPPLGRQPDRRAEGPEWRDPFKQPFRKAPDAMTQLHERCRCATLTNGFLDPRCFALLRTTSLGMTMMGPPLRG